MTDTTKLSITTGICAGLFVLACVFCAKVDQRRIEYIHQETKELEDFKTWAEEICANGYSTVEFLETREYKATCR